MSFSESFKTKWRKSWYHICAVFFVDISQEYELEINFHGNDFLESYLMKKWVNNCRKRLECFILDFYVVSKSKLSKALWLKTSNKEMFFFLLQYWKKKVFFLKNLQLSFKIKFIQEKFECKNWKSWDFDHFFLKLKSVTNPQYCFQETQNFN